MGKSTSNAVLGFLAGAAAGAITGILFAPDKGSKTRKKIKKSAEKISSDMVGGINDKVDDLKEYISDFINDVKGRFSKLESEVKEKVEKVEKEAAKTAEKKAKEAQ